jgi:alpha-ketoglutarate-dependent taurine dioxygenase
LLIIALVAERGVVFFRQQENLTNERHKELINRLGALGGRPKENGLYVHPLYKIRQEADPEIHWFKPSEIATHYGRTPKGDKKQTGIHEWHTDISFEQNPPDYSSLRLTDLPPGGGGGEGFPCSRTTKSLRHRPLTTFGRYSLRLCL